MRLADLAQLLDVTHAHLANLVRRGTLPAIRIGTAVRVSHRGREKINGRGCALRTAEEGAAVTERNFVTTTPHQLTFICQETADAAHTSLGLVRKHVREGKLESVRIGRCVRIPRQALLKLCGVQREEAQ